MRGLKQLVAFFVMLTMVASMFGFSVTVSAEETLPAVKITEKDNLLIEKLKTIGAISGEYSPSSYVTRRQMAKIIREYMNLPAEISGSGKSQFNDVPATDSDYNTIDALFDLEIISGDENGNFRPDDYVNYNEAVVFIINAVGHKYFAQREGGYPTGYMRVAIKHDMLENISMTNGEAYVPVIDVYKMLDAALTAATVNIQYYGDGSVRYTISNTENFLSKTYGIFSYRGKVTGNEYTCLSYNEKDITDEQIVIDGKIYDTPGCFYGYFLGYTVNYYAKYDKEAGLYTVLYIEEAPKMNATFRIDSEDILTPKVTDTRIYYEDENYEEEHIDTDSIIDVVYNGQFYTDFVSLRDIMPTNGYIEALDNDNDDVYDVLFVYDYQTVIVESVDTYEETIKDRNTGDIIYLSQNVKRVDIISSSDGLPEYLESIEKGNVLNIAISRGTEKVMTVYVSDKVINGQITGYQDNLGYEIGGTYYKDGCGTLSVGLKGDFYLDMNNKIVGYKYSSGADQSSVAVMAGLDYRESSISPEIQLKLFTSAGEFATISLKENLKIDNVKYDLTDDADFDDVLNIISKGFTSNGRYVVNDTYVVRYTLSLDKEIATMDTGAVGGTGYLNTLADEFTFLANRSPNMMYLTKAATGEKIYTHLSTTGVTFSVPASGELDDEKLYSVVSKMSGDHSWANPANRDNNFPGSSTTEIENYTAYHFASSEVPVIDVLLLRGGGGSASLSDDSSLYVLTDVADSADADGMSTKTLYQGKERIGQLAEIVNVEKHGTTTAYDAQTLIQNNIIKNGCAIRCATDNEGKITDIEMIAEYAGNVIVPLFSSTDYIESNTIWAVSKANHAVATINAYDNENNLLSFTAGEHNLIGTMDYAPVVKIYDTQTNKIRIATPADIRPDDKCVIRLRIFYRVSDIIIFR